MEVLVHHSDLNWLNIRKSGTTGWLISVGLTICSILILVFLTTPAALINILSVNETGSSFFSLAWVEKSPPFVKYLFQGLTPALMVSIVNSLLVLILTLLVEFERNVRFSTNHTSLMKRVFVYFLFNMLIVPGLANAATNLYELFQRGLNSYQDLMSNLFVLKTGDFFLILVIQSAGGAFLLSLNQIAPLIKNYLSPSISLDTFYLWKKAGDWRKEASSHFDFGTNYAFALVLLGIGFAFHSYIPFITVAVVYNLSLRHLANSAEIVQWHKHEFLSSALLVSLAHPA